MLQTKLSPENLDLSKIFAPGTEPVCTPSPQHSLMSLVHGAWAGGSAVSSRILNK